MFNHEELAVHLIKNGMTFNAENNSDPVITRPVRLEELVKTISDFFEKERLHT